MSYNFVQQQRKTVRVWSLFSAALVLACAFTTVTHAAAQMVTPPTTPTEITPPEGNSAFLVGHAFGTQGYVCLPSPGGTSWTVNPARPEATLFTDLFGQPFQIITHFLSPDLNPNKNAPDPLPPGAACRGRVPSIPEGYGHKRWERSPPARIWRVARIMARFL